MLGQDAPVDFAGDSSRVVVERMAGKEMAVWISTERSKTLAPVEEMR